MGIKTMWNTRVTEIAKTANNEHRADLRFEAKGIAYRYVKNAGVTDIPRSGCSIHPTAYDVNLLEFIHAPSIPGEATDHANLMAGIHPTTLYASGSETGDHGWVQVLGVFKDALAGTNATAFLKLIPCTTHPGSCFLTATDNLGSTYNVSNCALNITTAAGADGTSWNDVIVKCL